MLADNSMLSSYTRCQWLYGLRYELHRKPLALKLATDIGTLVHEFFSVYLSGADTQPTILSALETLQSYDFPPNEISIACGKYSQACVELTTNYPLVVSTNGTRLILTSNNAPRWIIRYPEIAFQLPLCERHQYMGRIDVIVEDGNQQLFILELKTSGFASQPAWRNYWPLATQPRGYVWAAAQHFTKTINGSIILPILMTTYGRNGSQYGTAKMTPEIPLSFTPQALESWKDFTIALMDEIERSSLLPTGQYNGGCSSSATGKCDYYDYCRSNYREGLLMQNTEEVIWDPRKIA